MVEDKLGEPEVVKRKQISAQKPYTVTGLAAFLGTTRQTLLDYELRDEFSDAIKAAKVKIESFAEESLYTNKASVAGTIFSLANNFGWKNKVEQENSGESKLVIETRHHVDEETDDSN
nr:MAG TPA: DNA packaging protein gp3 [Caudoviricetes sp.]